MSELEDLLLNKLNLDNDIKGIVKNIMHPFDNMKDYIKYGDMFIKLERNEDKKSNTHS